MVQNTECCRTYIYLTLKHIYSSSTKLTDIIFSVPEHNTGRSLKVRGTSSNKCVLGKKGQVVRESGYYKVCIACHSDKIFEISQKTEHQNY